MICIKVQFLAGKDKGYKELNIAEGGTLRDLMPAIGISEKDSCFFVVNGAIRPITYALAEGDDIKVFPAMSGG